MKLQEAEAVLQGHITSEDIPQDVYEALHTVLTVLHETTTDAAALVNLKQERVRREFRELFYEFLRPSEGQTMYDARPLATQLTNVLYRHLKGPNANADA